MNKSNDKYQHLIDDTPQIGDFVFYEDKCFRFFVLDIKENLLKVFWPSFSITWIQANHFSPFLVLKKKKKKTTHNKHDKAHI